MVVPRMEKSRRRWNTWRVRRTNRYASLRVAFGRCEAKLAVGFVNYVSNLIPSTRWKLAHGGSTANQRASGVWTLRAVKVVAYFASCLRNFLLVASRRWFTVRSRLPRLRFFRFRLGCVVSLFFSPLLCPSCFFFVCFFSSASGSLPLFGIGTTARSFS